jgi:ferrochelatase
VICPGFSADCLETLEEIEEENKEYFLESGGKKYSYIPALNDTPEHIECLADIIKQNL